MSNEIYRRLEGRQPFGDLQRGFRAEVHDPLWILGRQWQMGEHQGEDASSPVEVEFVAEHLPLAPHLNNPAMDPTVVPPEAIIESEPDDWWTPGRRIRLGKAFADAHGLPPVADADAELLLADLPFPYNAFNGRGYDGLKLFREGNNAMDPVFTGAGVPTTPPSDLWDPVELVYTTSVEAGAITFNLERHDGGDIDWYSVDANAAVPPGGTLRAPERVLPTRMQYPGAPHPRWWQIENHRVDIGAYGPDRGHFATMLLADLVSGHGDDWFTFPLTTEAGTIVKLHGVRIKDAFDEQWEVRVPSEMDPPQDWTLFSVTGLDASAQLVWPVAVAPLAGSEIEEVVLGIDEDANLLWAVEQRVAGREVPTTDAPVLLDPARPPPPTGAPSNVGARIAYRYGASDGARMHWHPYLLDTTAEGRRRFVQGRLADLDRSPPGLMPEPVAALLDPPGTTHQIEPATVPSQGLRLRRGWMMTRQTDGFPRLWIQRRRLPLFAPPISGLRFDVLDELGATGVE